jgi:hypothetical protein
MKTRRLKLFIGIEIQYTTCVGRALISNTDKQFQSSSFHILQQQQSTHYTFLLVDTFIRF